MTRPKKLEDQAVSTWLSSNAGWHRAGDEIEKTFSFDDYPSGLAFAVRVGFAAEKKDHHPELRISYGKVKVSWTTHDAGGLTELDLALASVCDVLAG